MTGTTAGEELRSTTLHEDSPRDDIADIVKATGKTLLDGIVKASDAFGPLKSAAAALNFIITNAEVRCIP